jgi:Aspartyl/Asparaginyl beta-hydroxylase
VTQARTVDLDRLRSALAEVSGWSEPSRFADTGVHHRYRRISLANGGRLMAAAAPFGWILDDYAPVRAAWLSMLEPGGFIIPHRDGGPYYERWHVPIRAAGWFDDTEPQDGVPFRVEHWTVHSLWNDSDRPRVHLVIDRDIPVPQPSASFTVYPIPPDRAELVGHAR